MKVKRIIALIIGLILIICSMSACGSNESSPVGEWYNERGKCLDIRKDGSWKLEDSYGTGTWKKLDDGTFEFTDYYGDIQESAINEDSLGKYIDFGYYGDFYKDAYPSENDISEKNTSEEDTSEEDTSEVKEKSAVKLDPFENLRYEVSGISPYCKISINNQGCADEVQKYVTYKLDKEYYANGETAVITAVLSPYTDEADYTLSSETSKYDLSNQPEYVTSIDNINIENIKAELDDYVKSNIAEAVKNGTEGYMYSSILGAGVSSELKQVENLASGEVYFQSKKLQKQADPNGYFNYLTFTYSGSYIGKYASGNFYSCVSAVNIIKYPDGTIKWGSESPDNYDFLAEGSTEGMEYTVSSFITVHSDNYNISKVE